MGGKYSKKGSGAPNGSFCPLGGFTVRAYTGGASGPIPKGRKFYDRTFRTEATAKDVAHDLKTMGSCNPPPRVVVRRRRGRR